MRKTVLSLAGLGALLVPLLPAGSAQATSTKTWVSAATGSDANPCSLINPCQTFIGALAKTSPGGAIGVLSPGEYGALLITKAVNISNDGVGEAGVQFGGVAIEIMTNAGDVVSLRGLVIDGALTGNAGIRLDGALAALHVQNCVIKNFEGSGGIGNWGLLYAPSVTSQLFVSDTIVLNNGSVANSGGILMLPQGGNGFHAVLDRVHLENNVIGLKVDHKFATSGSGVVVRDSVSSGNAGDGINISVPSGMPGAIVLIERSASVDNAGTGILASGVHAVALVSDSTMTRNGAGVSAVGGGQLISYGNNRNNNNLGPEGTATSMLAPF